MKQLINTLILLFFALSVCFSQSFANSGTAIISSEGSSHEIAVDIDAGQNMRICMDEEEFIMHIRFHNSLDDAIENVLAKNLNFSEDDASSLDGMQFSLNSGVLEATADLDNMTIAARERLRNLTRELFVILNWKVDLKGL